MIHETKDVVNFLKTIPIKDIKEINPIICLQFLVSDVGKIQV